MKRSTSIVRIIFWLYLVIITWGILFKFATRLYDIPFFMNYRYINWMPFAEPLIVDGRIIWEEMVFNLLAFAPFGFLFPLRNPKTSTARVLLFGCLLSLLYEVLQYMLAIGMADVTDLVMNTLGVCSGLMIYKIVKGDH